MEKLKFPYRNEYGHRYTKALFLELMQTIPLEERVADAPFTLHRKLEGYICFGDEYVNDGDPTGYTTSKRLLGEYAYWKYLEKRDWFREALAVWNEELDAKLASEGIRKIRELALGDDAKALQAAKYLSNLEHKRNGAKRGRPSKEEIQGNIAIEADEARRLQEDLQRISLVTKGN